MELSRRELLTGVCALAVTGGVVAVALPAAAESAIRRLPDGRVSVRIRAVQALSTVGGAVRIGDVKGQPTGLARTGRSTYVAFSLRCPHQGAPVDRSPQGWVCPAHGSEFKPDGKLVLGPATSGLKRIPTRASGNQVIVG